MELGEIEIELINFGPLSTNEEYDIDYDLEHSAWDCWLIKRAVYPKNVIIKDGSDRKRLSDFSDVIFRENKCLILQLVGEDYSGRRRPFSTFRDKNDELCCYELTGRNEYLLLYEKLGEVEFLKKFNSLRYDIMKIQKDNLLSLLNRGSNKRNLSDIKIEIELLRSYLDRCEDWFLADGVESNKNELDSKEEWNKTWIDLIRECLKKVNRNDCKTLDGAFNWAIAKYRIKGKDIEFHKLQSRCKVEISRHRFYFKNGKYFEWSKTEGDKIID